MPLLGRELEIFPQNGIELPSEELPWWVAHTRSRQEKALARMLRPLGVPFYLPQWEKSQSRGGRTRSSFLPLFPGYVFFRGGAAERQAALRSNLLVRVLEVPNQQQLGHELGQLRALQNAGLSLVPLVEFRPGDRVRIVDGPFRGHDGVILRGEEKPRLVVSVSMLRRAVAVEIDRGFVVQTSPRRLAREARSAVA